MAKRGGIFDSGLNFQKKSTYKIQSKRCYFLTRALKRSIEVSKNICGTHEVRKKMFQLHTTPLEQPFRPTKILTRFHPLFRPFCGQSSILAQNSTCWPLQAQTRAETCLYSPVDLRRNAGLNPKAPQSTFLSGSIFYDFLSFGLISALVVKTAKKN